MRVNNGSTLQPWNREVRLDSSNLKAWFRGAQASELLGLAEQGLYFCRGALQLDPKESPEWNLEKWTTSPQWRNLKNQGIRNT